MPNSKFILRAAPRAGLEPAAYCLGGRSVQSLDVAGRGPACHPPAMSMAGRGLAWLVSVVVGSPFGSPASLAPLTFSKHERQPATLSMAKLRSPLVAR